MSDTRTLYLIDGTAQLFRAFFAIRGLSNEDRLPTGAVFGFTAMLRKPQSGPSRAGSPGFG